VQQEKYEYGAMAVTGCRPFFCENIQEWKWNADMNIRRRMIAFL
jgi:hypothetical protein